MEPGDIGQDMSQKTECYNEEAAITQEQASSRPRVCLISTASSWIYSILDLKHLWGYER